jgi:hypothetical protein
MKASDLLNSQLELLAHEGKIIAHGRRGFLIDTAFFDALRTELVGLLGEDEARSAFTRLGYAMGHNAARRLRDRYSWNDKRELLSACPALLAWSGLADANQHSSYGPGKVSFSSPEEKPSSGFMPSYASATGKCTLRHARSISSLAPKA